MKRLIDMTIEERAALFRSAAAPLTRIAANSAVVQRAGQQWAETRRKAATR